MILGYRRSISEYCRVDGRSEDDGSRIKGKAEVEATTRTGKVESTLKSDGPEPVYAPFDLIFGLQSTTLQFSLLLFTPYYPSTVACT